MKNVYRVNLFDYDMSHSYMVPPLIFVMISKLLCITNYFYDVFITNINMEEAPYNMT